MRLLVALCVCGWVGGAGAHRAVWQAGGVRHPSPRVLAQGPTAAAATQCCGGYSMPPSPVPCPPPPLSTHPLKRLSSCISHVTPGQSGPHPDPL